MIWHYTKHVHLPAITKERLIKPAEKYIGVNERPIVWFSTNPLWERTVHDIQQLLAMGIYPARIGVSEETAPYPFNKLRRLSRMKARTADDLINAASRLGADPKEWRGTLDPVPSELWQSVEVWKDKQWISQEGWR
jgi:hypothetical protein